MKEIQSIVALARQTGEGESLALATVVKIRGSAYRRPGARMLVTCGGRTAGMISGGCLENDVRERAAKVMATGRSCLLTYDSSSPYDIVFGLGLGCNGIVQVLVEKVSAGDVNGLLALFGQCLETRSPAGVATVFDGHDVANGCLGAHLLRWPDGRTTATTEDTTLLAALHAAAAEAEGRRAAIRPLPLADGRRLGALIETVAPPVPLVVFGAGDDAMPLASVAKQLGWHVTVIDARPDYAKAERFAGADSVLCLRPEATPDLPPEAVAMIMTHSFTRDKALLRALLPRRLHYVGALGPKVRTQKLIQELSEEVTTFSREELAPLHGPAGLDIGAETPEQIAVSIIAEIQAVLTRRPGTPLRSKSSGIHDEVSPVPPGSLMAVACYKSGS